MLRKPFPYQQKVLDFMQGRDRSALFLDPGLGKTLCALRGLNLAESSGRTLCVVPASLIPNWERECKLEGLNRDKIDIISYERLVSDVKGHMELVSPKDTERQLKLLKRHYVIYDNLIVDESHFARNVLTARSQALLKIHRFIKKAAFLTGTPTITSNQDLFLTLSLCEPGKWGQYEAFGQMYCDEIWDPYKKVFKYSGYRNSDLLARRMQKCCIVMKKEDVLDDLPCQLESILSVYNIKFEEGFTGSFAELFANSTEDHISTIRREAAFAKMHDYIRTLKARRVPGGLVFVWHKDVAEELNKMLPGKSEIISGDVAVDKRYELVDKYQAGKLKWLVITMGAGGVGLNLQRTQYVGFFEIPWTYAEADQALSRAVRIGNDYAKVFVEFVLFRGSIDEAIYNIMRGREADAELLLEDLKVS